MKHIIIGERYREKLELSLISHGFSPFFLPKNPNISYFLASHCDLSVFLHGKTAVLASCFRNNEEIVNYLTNRGCEILFSSKDQDEDYPRDINLCAVSAGDKIIHNLKYTDPVILKLGAEYINVNQGYAKCSCLLLDSNHIITADKGILRALANTNIDTLEISDSGISLDGYDKGFIGGASFVCGDTVFFTGDINRHPDSDKIKEYISSLNMEYRCLTEERLFDIGGAIIMSDYI